MRGLLGVQVRGLMGPPVRRGREHYPGLCTFPNRMVQDGFIAFGEKLFNRNTIEGVKTMTGSNTTNLTLFWTGSRDVGLGPRLWGRRPVRKGTFQGQA